MSPGRIAEVKRIHEMGGRIVPMQTAGVDEKHTKGSDGLFNAKKSMTKPSRALPVVKKRAEWIELNWVRYHPQCILVFICEFYTFSYFRCNVYLF